MTSKYLPRDPTPEMVEKVARIIAGHFGAGWEVMFDDKSDWIAHRGENAGGYHDVNAPRRADCRAAAVDILGCLAASLPLKRTEPPSTPGWYWARIRNEDVRPEPLAVFIANGVLLAAWGHPPLPLDGFEWFGPIPLPEVEP